MNINSTNHLLSWNQFDPFTNLNIYEYSNQSKLVNIVSNENPGCLIGNI